MATSKSKSYFESITGKATNPLWILRGFTAAAIVCLTLALFVFKTGGPHGFCVGLALGVLIGLLTQLSSISNVELNSTPQRSDVENLSVTS